MNECKYLNKKDKECGKECQVNYCDKHSIYEGNVDPNDMKQCSICICGLRFTSGGFSYCESCREKRSKKKKEKIDLQSKCEFIYVNGSKCESSSINNKNYCGNHIKYDGIVPNKLNQMSECSKCKKRIESNTMCDTCRDYINNQAKNRKLKIVKCAFLTQNDDQCPFQKYGQHYCKRHNEWENKVKPNEVIHLGKCNKCRNRYIDKCNKCK
jgi:hypothetical protein